MKNLESYAVKGKKNRRRKKQIMMAQKKQTESAIQPEVQSKIHAIISGKEILKLTYDRVFRAIFDPDIHRGRLERFLSQLMGRRVRIVKSVPVEGNNRTIDAKRVYLDILVEFEDGSLANVEMQRVGKLFPNKRATVYSSDLIIRQYAVAKSKIKEQHVGIDYNDIKNVYTIVIIEDSTDEFDQYKDHYLHRGKVVFDTGLDMDMLQEYIFVNLDFFSELVQDIHTELEAWLAYLNAETVEDIERIIDVFPDFQSIQEDVILYVRREPEEVQRAMLEYSVEMDENGFRNKINRQKKEIEQLQLETQELEKAKKKVEAAKQQAEAETQRLEAAKQQAEAETQRLEAAKQEAEADAKQAEVAKQNERYNAIKNMLSCGIEQSAIIGCGYTEQEIAEAVQQSAH